MRKLPKTISEEEDKIEEFRKYILSEQWHNFKTLRFRLDDNKCVLCKSNINLNCHHLTYERIYHELIDDVITLCSRCHSRIHRISPPKYTPSFVKTNAYDELYKPTPEQLKKTFEEIKW